MEANIKAIIVKDGIGREINPHRKPKYIDQVPYIQSESNKLWIKFERFVVKRPCPELANTKPGETVEAELVDAVEKGSGKIEIYDVKPLYGIRELGWKEIKIWRLVKEEKDMKKEISISEQTALNEMRKHALMSLPTDSEVAEWHDLNIDPNDATVSSAIYKFRLWLKDRLTPPTLK